LKKEFYDELRDPRSFLEALRKSGPRCDIFTFLEEFPPSAHEFEHRFEWDNVAAIAVSTFEEWHRSVSRSTRRALRKASDAGIVVRWVDFDADLIRRIKEIFDESPVRQGRPFWHYKKSFDYLNEMLSRDADVSRYLGAFVGEEMVGFVKLISGRNFARTALILSKIAHRSKYPNNALIAKALEVCAVERVPYLVYGQMDYGKVGSQALADFKTHNGFRKILLRRYFVPMSPKGYLVMRAGLHHGPLSLVPRWLIQGLLRLRSEWYARTLGSA
jgi:hypothetical protein